MIARRKRGSSRKGGAGPFITSVRHHSICKRTCEENRNKNVFFWFVKSLIDSLSSVKTKLQQTLSLSHSHSLFTTLFFQAVIFFLMYFFEFFRLGWLMWEWSFALTKSFAARRLRRWFSVSDKLPVATLTR